MDSIKDPTNFRSKVTSDSIYTSLPDKVYQFTKQIVDSDSQIYRARKWSDAKNEGEVYCLWPDLFNYLSIDL